MLRGKLTRSVFLLIPLIIYSFVAYSLEAAIRSPQENIHTRTHTHTRTHMTHTQNTYKGVFVANLPDTNQ
jgi:hypothetical protein